MNKDFVAALSRLISEYHLEFDTPPPIIAKHMYNAALLFEDTNREINDYHDALDDYERYSREDEMDGDHASALASAGYGTDEDYGGGDNERF
jgi:hypothetical protein